MHILYSGWPDHFVAESTSTCREVRALVLKYYRKKPIVVHCSAGVGRFTNFFFHFFNIYFKFSLNGYTNLFSK